MSVTLPMIMDEKTFIDFGSSRGERITIPKNVAFLNIIEPDQEVF